MLKEKLAPAFSFLQTTSPPLIGVDISSSALKLVELSEAGKGAYRLERYAVEPLPKDVVADGNIANLDQVAEALRRAHKRLGSRNRNVAMALPTAMVITKKIIVPSGQTEEELELQVEAEANQYIPFALDEVNLDFQIDLVQGEGNVLVGLGFDLQFELFLGLARRDDDLLGNHHGGGQGHRHVAVARAQAFVRPAQRLGDLVEVGNIAVGD